MKQRVFDVIEAWTEDDRLSHIYDFFMIIVIIVSLLPLTVKHTNGVLVMMDHVTVTIFIIDYILRLWTADLKLKKGALSYFIYPFTPMAILDLVSILPTLALLNNAFRAARLLRLLRALKVIRTFKLLRYSRSIHVLVNVLKKQSEPLLAVLCMLVGYIMVSALIVFNVEPDSFNSFQEAIYWATVSLTTVGYGDIAPVSNIGRFITMVSSIFGVVIIALPSGIVTAGYLEEIGMSMPQAGVGDSPESDEEKQAPII